MDWAGYEYTDSSPPRKVEYHCSECGWKGDYDWIEGGYDEYSPEDYEMSLPLEDALRMVEELGGDITYLFDFDEDDENPL